MLQTNRYYELFEKISSNQKYQIVTIDKIFQLKLPLNYDFKLLQIRSITLVERKKFRNATIKSFNPNIFQLSNGLNCNNAFKATFFRPKFSKKKTQLSLNKQTLSLFGDNDFVLNNQSNYLHFVFKRNIYKAKAIRNHFVKKKNLLFFDPFYCNENGMFGISNNLCKSSFNTTHDIKSKSSFLEEFSSKVNGNNFVKKITNKDKNRSNFIDEIDDLNQPCTKSKENTVFAEKSNNDLNSRNIDYLNISNHKDLNRQNKANNSKDNSESKNKESFTNLIENSIPIPENQITQNRFDDIRRPFPFKTDRNFKSDSALPQLAKNKLDYQKSKNQSILPVNKIDKTIHFSNTNLPEINKTNLKLSQSLNPLSNKTTEIKNNDINSKQIDSKLNFSSEKNDSPSVKNSLSVLKFNLKDPLDRRLSNKSNSQSFQSLTSTKSQIKSVFEQEELGLNEPFKSKLLEVNKQNSNSSIDCNKKDTIENQNYLLSNSSKSILPKIKTSNDKSTIDKNQPIPIFQTDDLKMISNKQSFVNKDSNNKTNQIKTQKIKTKSKKSLKKKVNKNNVSDKEDDAKKIDSLNPSIHYSISNINSDLEPINNPSEEQILNEKISAENLHIKELLKRTNSLQSLITPNHSKENLSNNSLNKNTLASKNTSRIEDERSKSLRVKKKSKKSNNNETSDGKDNATVKIKLNKYYKVNFKKRNDTSKPTDKTILEYSPSEKNTIDVLEDIRKKNLLRVTENLSNKSLNTKNSKTNNELKPGNIHLKTNLNLIPKIESKISINISNDVKLDSLSKYNLKMDNLSEISRNNSLLSLNIDPYIKNEVKINFNNTESSKRFLPSNMFKTGYLSELYFTPPYNFSYFDLPLDRLIYNKNYSRLSKFNDLILNIKLDDKFKKTAQTTNEIKKQKEIIEKIFCELNKFKEQNKTKNIKMKATQGYHLSNHIKTILNNLDKYEENFNYGKFFQEDSNENFLNLGSAKFPLL